MERLQYVKLNGSISDGLDFVTFGARQYARRASEHDVWYDQFVRDYSQHVTILVGTKVNEPLFWQAIEARQGRHGAAQELRLGSFLVADKIAPVVLNSLADFNVSPIEASAEEFFTYMDKLVGDVPERDEMLEHVNPQRAQYRKLASGSSGAEDAAKAFFAAFTRVEVQDAPKSHRSLYHHGATPDWLDLAVGLDAQREVTAQAQEKIEAAIEDGLDALMIVVTGHRGAGKSTLMMRTALNLSAAGHLIFFAVGEDLPEAHVIASAVDLMNRRVALFVDDAEWVGGRAERLADALGKTRIPPVLVLGVRANSLFDVEDLQREDIWLGPLTDKDIDAVVEVLERANALGVMTGLPLPRIRDAFKFRAKKQLLVAMKEVTTGLEFDDIIKREFNDIEDPELRLTYLIACLATAAGTSLTRGQLLASSELPPALLLSGLNRELRDVVVHASEYGDRVIARHSVIAQTIVEKVAPKSALSTAYKRILSVLANDMDPHARRGEVQRAFRLYKVLIRHADIYRRFEKNLEEARSIFDTLMATLTNEAHYWLQFGSLELEYGELDFATRYINTAESLAPNDFLIRNAKGHLLLELGRAAKSFTEAEALRHQAEDILDELIADEGDRSDYPWHILIAHTVDWIETWIHDIPQRRKELQVLRQRADEACEARPRSQILMQLRERVERAYLATAL